MKQLLYTMFVSINRALFLLLSKKNWLKHHKVPKYFENDSLQNFLSFFMSLLTVQIV